MERKAFIRSIIGASAGIMLSSTSSFGRDKEEVMGLIDSVSRSTSGSMFQFKTNGIEKVRVGMIGLGNRGTTLLQMLQWLVENDHCEIVGLSDLREEKVKKAAETLKTFQKASPELYFGNEDSWKKMAGADGIDLLVIATPWEEHTPMCLYGMSHGKHVACEVPIAYSLSDCWSLVEMAEKTQKHCIMLENCCYNEEELFVLNMIENGVFGDLTHTEGAYLHDLRAHMLSDDYYENQWRLKHHINRDGNFYTTHGLGPISFYLNIGRGDTYDHLTSMSSRELNLSETAKKQGSPYREFKCGDMNTTMIRTQKGKSIMLQFDVHTGRPYSRINKVVGTKAVHDGYPSRLYIDSGEPVFWGHNWLSDEEYNGYREKYKHPIIHKLKKISQGFKQGHGGMDFVMMYRLIRCLNLGLPLDINLYDSVMWSAITPLSEISVASKSMSVPFPDFTNGQWQKDTPLEVMREI